MKINEKQAAQLEYIRNLPDDQIDTSDAPEVLDWRGARRGLLYRPVKRDAALNLDEYVIDWFAGQHPEKAERDEAINKILMDHIRGQILTGKKNTKETATEEAGS